MNKDYETREHVIFNEAFNSRNYSGGIRRFTCNTETLRNLYLSDFIDGDERQNESPSTTEFLDYVDDYPNVTFECYAVSPERDDYRITVEAINIVIPETDYDAVSYFTETFRYADEFNLDHVRHNYYLRAWWD